MRRTLSHLGDHEPMISMLRPFTHIFFHIGSGLMECFHCKIQAVPVVFSYVRIVDGVGEYFDPETEECPIQIISTVILS